MPNTDLHLLHILGVIHKQGAEESDLLMEDDEHRQLAIPVGICEATAVERGLNRTNSERPLTHDLLATLAERLGSPVVRVEIDDFSQGIFYARIILQDGDTFINVDCRPSDGIAIALRIDVPIFATDTVMTSME